MNPYNAKEAERLYGAVESAYRNLISYRMSQRRLIRAYAGSDYGRYTLNKLGPLPTVNLIQQTAEAYQVALAYNTPRFQCKTHNPEHQSFAEKLKTAINNVCHLTRIEVEFGKVILDAFFRIGVFKLLLPDDVRVETESDPYMSPGLPYGARVGLDYWVHDTGCTDIRLAAFMGDQYTIPMETAVSGGVFSKEFAAQLIPDNQNEGQDDYEKSESISKNMFEGNDTAIEDMVRLCDIYLPRERLILTCPCNRHMKVKDGAKPFIREWEGGETGPYHLLSFADIPDNAMPFSVSENLFGLFMLYNNLLAKASMRALKEKDVPWYTASGEQDMKRAIATSDMGPIRIDNKDSIGVMKMGGIDSNLMLFDMNVLEIFNRSAGNLDMMLGLAPSAPTATQDQQLGQALGGRLAHLRKRTNRFASSVGEGLGDMIFYDPELTIPGRRDRGNGYSTDATWYPPHLLPRQGSIRDYQIPVEPYSMEYKSPEQRLATMMRNVEATMPLMPMLAQQGTVFEGRRFIEKISEMSDDPDFLQLFRIEGLPEQPAEDSASMGANQPREYVRHNVAGGATAQGRQYQQVQAMARMAGSENGDGGSR